MRERWEYQVTVIEEVHTRRPDLGKIIARLNALGWDGWEVAGVSTPTNATSVTVFLKRRVEGP